MMTIPVCPYCQADAVLCDASAVYGPTYAGKFNMWVCANYPDCDSYVGCHKDSADAKPLGTMANAELRKLRKRIHAMFDPLWKPGPEAKFKGRKARLEAYWWITDALGITGTQFHTAHADAGQCRSALAVLIAAQETGAYGAPLQGKKT